ncbi:hypothetical protein [Streptomyces coeruleorubidus]|uniref:hypothetical protein n=1 Tax=Streptomyces coeruleorubidus TaxID=116188 RepID=UPI0033C00DAB
MSKSLFVVRGVTAGGEERGDDRGGAELVHDVGWPYRADQLRRALRSRAEDAIAQRLGVPPPLFLTSSDASVTARPG